MKNVLIAVIASALWLGCGPNGVVQTTEPDGGTGGGGGGGSAVGGGGGGAVDGPDASTPEDAGVQQDAGVVVDAGTPDAGSPDAGAPLGTITNHGVVNPNCPNDMAEIVSWQFPTTMSPNWLAEARVTVRNNGTTNWSEVDQVRLGSPGNVDPFADNARVLLANGVTVLGDPATPGLTTFVWDLKAPAAEGDYDTRWQMVREHVCWFGDVITAPIKVRMPVATGVCANPTPHGLDQMAAVIHQNGPTRVTLDSTPKVCDRHYCLSIGFTDGRTCCPPRPEGNPDVDVCNEAIVGRAADTGRVGPTWTLDGQLCAPAGPGNCENHPDNQFLLWVFGPGTAQACGNLNGVCGTVVVP